MKAVHAVFVSIMLVMFITANASADPEKAYQAGKKAAGLPKVDDRDWEGHARDAAREAGKRTGANKPKKANKSKKLEKPGYGKER